MEEQLCQKLIDFIRIVARLREPGGCPWDQKQTPQTFKTYLIEEVYELVDAIDQDDPAEVRGELGDMLFQLLFISNLYQEQGHFTLVEVIDGISAKMIRRHPHVFGDAKIDSLQELKEQWYSIKATERGAVDRPSHQLQSMPKGLPALRRAHRVQERAAKIGFSPESRTEILDAMSRLLADVRQATTTGDRAAASEALGDLLLKAANLGRLLEISAEESLQARINDFIARFIRFEQVLDRLDIGLNELEVDRQKELWNEVKSD